MRQLLTIAISFIFIAFATTCAEDSAIAQFGTVKRIHSETVKDADGNPVNLHVDMVDSGNEVVSTIMHLNKCKYTVSLDLKQASQSKENAMKAYKKLDEGVEVLLKAYKEGKCDKPSNKGVFFGN